MLNWIIRGLMVIAGVVASWLVAKDSPQFEIMEMAVAMLLVVFIVAVLAVLPERCVHFIKRVHRG